MFSDWTHFVEDKARVWRQTNLDWIYNFTGPHHIIFYENLVQNLEPELRGVLRFLNVPVSEEQLKCALQRSEGNKIFSHIKENSIYLFGFDLKSVLCIDMPLCKACFTCNCILDKYVCTIFCYTCDT